MSNRWKGRKLSRGGHVTLPGDPLRLRCDPRSTFDSNPKQVMGSKRSVAVPGKGPSYSPVKRSKVGSLYRSCVALVEYDPADAFQDPS